MTTPDQAVSTQTATPEQTPEQVMALIAMEYKQLKDEQTARIIARDGMIAVTLGSIVLAAAKVGPLNVPLVLLALPAGLLIMGWTYLANDRKVTEIGHYVGRDLAQRAQALVPGWDPFAWETRHLKVCGRRRHKRIQAVVDLVMFCGSAAAALALLWSNYHLPSWAATTALVELAATVALGWEILRAADLNLHRPQRALLQLAPHERSGKRA
jgi:hypothetical protein